jgi:hypothetical protein
MPCFLSHALSYPTHHAMISRAPLLPPLSAALVSALCAREVSLPCNYMHLYAGIHMQVLKTSNKTLRGSEAARGRGHCR